MHRNRDAMRRKSSFSRTPESSHPATGIYSSDLTTESNYDSSDEYHVDFPKVELKLPDRRNRKSTPSEVHEHLVISKCVDRRGVYEELPEESASRHTSYSCFTDVTPANQCSRSGSSTYQPSYYSQNRIQSISNIFGAIITFFRDNPSMTKILLSIVVCYAIVCNLEILIPKTISIVVRLFYPWARYWTVVAEQFFSAIANMFTRMDAVIYASYCEFAAKYCRSRRLMCDVTCSFVDHVLSQSRPHLAPIPQN